MALWYYNLNGQQSGPVEDDEMRAMLASGMVRAETLVWRDGMTEWLPVIRTPEWSSQLANPTMASPYALPPMSGLAVASLSCGIGSLMLMMMCWIGILAAVPGAICGHMALRQMREYILPMRGRGMAIAGLVTSYLTIAITVGGLVFFGVMIMIAGNA